MMGEKQGLLHRQIPKWSFHHVADCACVAPAKHLQLVLDKDGSKTPVDSLIMHACRVGLAL